MKAGAWLSWFAHGFSAMLGAGIGLLAWVQDTLLGTMIAALALVLVVVNLLVVAIREL
jgi:hypothetical protein